MKEAEIQIGSDQYASDLFNEPKQADDCVTEAFYVCAMAMSFGAQTLNAIANVLSSHPDLASEVTARADKATVFIKGPDRVIDELLEKGLAQTPPLRAKLNTTN